MKRAIAVLTLALSSVSVSVNAGENVGGRKIVDIGCHSGDGTCFVTLDGAPFGASLSCRTSATNEFRFDNGDTAIGRRTYASFLAAMLSGRTVSVYIDGCSSQGAPTLLWFHIN